VELTLSLHLLCHSVYTSTQYSTDPVPAQDPEGLLAPPQPGHIARRKFQKRTQEEGLEEEKLLEQQQREAARLEQKRMVSGGTWGTALPLVLVTSGWGAPGAL